MLLLTLGLLLFIAPHSVRFVAPGFREAAIERLGEGPWKGLYALVSLAGLVLVGRGWGEASVEPIHPGVPGAAGGSLILMLPLLVLLIAGNLPAGHIKRALKHPMMIATLGWSLLHLAANGEARAALLFGALAVWSAFELASLMRRERAAALGPHGAMPPPDAAPVPWWPDIAALGIGVAAYVFLVAGGHVWLFGVAPGT